MKKLLPLFYCLTIYQHSISQMLEGTDSERISLPKKTKVTFEKIYLPYDDSSYNPRYSLIYPVVRTTMVNLFNWSRAYYLERADWAKINGYTWKENLKFKFAWDGDDIYTNFFGHSFTGNNYYNTARSNGYSMSQSVPFAILGSLTWELFGETELPSGNDLIATPTGGIFFGEILYRLSSNILDDRRRGGNRVCREVLAGLTNPTRALNRLTSGKMFRIAPKEIYQKIKKTNQRNSYRYL